MSEEPKEIDGGSLEERALVEKIIARVRTVYDPEIPVNIYDLGLVYKIDLTSSENQKYALRLEMTLTAPGCPMADEIVAMVYQIVSDLPELSSVAIELVWDPPWTMAKMSDEAKMDLDFMD